VQSRIAQYQLKKSALSKLVSKGKCSAYTLLACSSSSIATKNRVTFKNVSLYLFKNEF
jgi:hypothetical protein